MRTKIDRVITKVSGSSDYMGDMAKITGNIKTVDKEYYIQRLNIIDKTFKVIDNELKLHVDNSKSLKQFHQMLNENYDKLEILNPYSKHVNKKSQKVKYKLRLAPKNIYESEWFKLMKTLETSAASLCQQFEIDKIKIEEKQEKIFKENPDTVNAFKFFDLLVTDPKVYQTIFITHSYINKILEIVLSPAYDAKKFIINHWLPQIDEIIGSKIQSEEEMTRSDIQNFVYTFVLAKYRLELTSDSEEFTKVLLQSMSETNIIDMDAGRFLNIIDNINLDKLDKKDNVYKFAEATKTEIQKIMSGEKLNPTEILKDIENILNTGAVEEVETVESDVEDIF